MNKILDIGCGNSKVTGAVGIDFIEGMEADIIHDLNIFPYPLADAEFDEIHVLDTLCLLEDPVKVMEEIYH